MDTAYVREFPPSKTASVNLDYDVTVPPFVQGGRAPTKWPYG